MIDALAKSTGSTISNLQTALEDEPSALVKAGIAEVIARKGPSDSEVTTLAASVLSTDPTTRVEAVRLLGRTRPAAGREALELVATNRAELVEIRAIAAVALGRAGSDAESALAALIAADDVPERVRVAALRGLALTGSGGVKTVAAAAGDSKAPRAIREGAIAALGDPDAKSEDALIELLSSKSDATRTLVLRAVASRGAKSDGITSALTDRLADSSAGVRAATVGVLVTLGGASASKTEILGLLDDGEEAVQIAAIDALGRGFASGDTKVADALADLVEHKSFVIRYHAALALGAMGDDRGLDAMKNHKDSETAVEKAAADDAANQIDAQTKK